MLFITFKFYIKLIMVILRSQIFRKYPEIIFGFSTKIGSVNNAPYYFNMSKSVGDEEGLVDENRKHFFEGLDLSLNNVVLQKQNHTDIITYVTEGGLIGESDAMITDRKGLGLAASSADCTLIFLYDRKNKVIAAVHSGWRGTELRILEKTLQKLKDDFNTDAGEITAYIAPSICQMEYEVGPDFSEKFCKKYLIPRQGKYLLDVAGINYDILINFGVEGKNIQKSEICSYRASSLLHSYRRDGAKSGRALGVIALKG